MSLPASMSPLRFGGVKGGAQPQHTATPHGQQRALRETPSVSTRHPLSPRAHRPTIAWSGSVDRPAPSVELGLVDGRQLWADASHAPFATPPMSTRLVDTTPLIRRQDHSIALRLPRTHHDTRVNRPDTETHPIFGSLARHADGGDAALWVDVRVLEEPLPTVSGVMLALILCRDAICLRVPKTDFTMRVLFADIFKIELEQQVRLVLHTGTESHRQYVLDCRGAPSLGLEGAQIAPKLFTILSSVLLTRPVAFPARPSATYIEAQTELLQSAVFRMTSGLSVGGVGDDSVETVYHAQTAAKQRDRSLSAAAGPDAARRDGWNPFDHTTYDGGVTADSMDVSALASRQVSRNISATTGTSAWEVPPSQATHSTPSDRPITTRDGLLFEAAPVGGVPAAAVPSPSLGALSDASRTITVNPSMPSGLGGHGDGAEVDADISAVEHDTVYSRNTSVASAVPADVDPTTVTSDVARRQSAPRRAPAVSFTPPKPVMPLAPPSSLPHHVPVTATASSSPAPVAAPYPQGLLAGPEDEFLFRGAFPTVGRRQAKAGNMAFSLPSTFTSTTSRLAATHPSGISSSAAAIDAARAVSPEGRQGRQGRASHHTSSAGTSKAHRVALQLSSVAEVHRARESLLNAMQAASLPSVRSSSVVDAAPIRGPGHYGGPSTDRPSPPRELSPAAREYGAPPTATAPATS